MFTTIKIGDKIKTDTPIIGQVRTGVVIEIIGTWVIFENSDENMVYTSKLPCVVKI